MKRISVSFRAIITISLFIHFILNIVPMCNLLPKTIYWIILLTSNCLLIFFSIQWKTRRLKKKITIFLLLILLFDALYSLVKEKSLPQILTANILMLQFWIPMLAALFFAGFQDKKYGKKVFNGLMLIIFFVIFATLAGLGKNPEAAREIAGGEGRIEYYKNNIGGYSFIYGLVPLVAYLLWLFKQKRNALYLMGAVIAFLCILKAQFTISIAIALLGAFMAIILKNPQLRKILLAAGILLSSMFCFSAFTARVLNYFAELCVKLNIDYLAQRFWGYAEILSVTDTTNRAIDMRLEVYINDLKLFFDNPLTGSLFKRNQGNINGHSDILGTAGGLGMVGICLFIFIFAFFFFILKKNFISKKCMQMMLLGVAIFIFLIVLNSIIVSPLVSYVIFLTPILLEERGIEWT